MWIVAIRPPSSRVSSHWIQSSRPAYRRASLLFWARPRRHRRQSSSLDAGACCVVLCGSDLQPLRGCGQQKQQGCSFVALSLDESGSTSFTDSGISTEENIGVDSGHSAQFVCAQVAHFLFWVS